MDGKIIVKTNPWVLVLQGLVIIAIAVFVLINPEISLELLTRILGLILIVAAVLLFFSAYYKQKITNQLLFFQGVITAGIGLVFALFPALLANAFIVLLGVISFLSGLVNLWLLIRIRISVTNASFLRNGLLLLFGIFLLINPGRGQEAIAVIIGIFSLTFGVISLYGAVALFRTKNSTF